MANRAATTESTLFAWRHSRGIQLGGIGVLAGIVLLRLGLMTYWSLGSISYAHSGARLLLAWCLGVVVLAMLWRFAWQIYTGRHRTK